MMNSKKATPITCPIDIVVASDLCKGLIVAGQFDQAILCAQKLLDTIEEQGIVCDPPDILYNHYLDQRDMMTPTIFMNYLHRLLNYSEKHALAITQCYATFYKAYVYYMTRQNEDARVWYEKANSLAIELENHRVQAMCLNSMGNIHYLLGNLDQAEAFYLGCWQLVQTYNIEELRYNRHNLGLIALKRKDFSQALNHMEVALEFATITENANLKANSYSDMAEVFLAKGDLQQALQLFQKALNYEDSFLTSINLRDSYLGMAKTYEALENYEKAYFYLKRYDELYALFSEKQEKDHLARMEQTYILQHWEHERQLNEQLTASIASLQATQAQLIQTEKRVALNRMLSGIAHHLNTPLGNAIGVLSYLQQESSTEEMDLVAMSLERMRAFLTIIEESFVNATALKVSQIHLITFIRGIQKANFGGNMIALTIIGENIAINTFDKMLERVLIALLTNAIIHSGLPKPVPVTIVIQSSEKEVVISVIDYGKGISQEMIQSVFDPFMTSNMGKSNGLGLYVAKQYVTEILGGDLSVSSEFGHSTRFQLNLIK